MLKKLYRGLSADQVTELFDEKVQFVADRFFHINWMKVDQTFPQFVVITPKKLALNAVERNRYQRRAYAAISAHFSLWTVGMRVAIVVKKAALAAKPGEFTAHLQKLITLLHHS